MSFGFQIPQKMKDLVSSWNLKFKQKLNKHVKQFKNLKKVVECHSGIDLKQ